MDAGRRWGWREPFPLHPQDQRGNQSMGKRRQTPRKFWESRRGGQRLLGRLECRKDPGEASDSTASLSASSAGHDEGRFVFSTTTCPPLSPSPPISGGETPFSVFQSEETLSRNNGFLLNSQFLYPPPQYLCTHIRPSVNNAAGGLFVRVKKKKKVTVMTS